MPAIPKYSGSFRESTSQTIDINQPLRDAQNIAGTIQDVGSAVAKVKQAEELIDEKIKVYNDKQDLQKAELGFQESSQNLLFEAKTKFKDDPAKALEYLKENREKIKSDVLTGIRSQDVKDVFGFQAEKTFLNIEDDVRSWTVSQTINNAKDINNKLVDTQATRAYTLAESGQANLAKLNEILSPIAMFAESSKDVLSQADRDALVLTGKRKVALDYGQGLLDKNEITRAKELVKSEEHREILGADGISTLNRAIKAKIEQNKELAEKRSKALKTEPWTVIGPEGGFINFNPSQDPEGERLKSSLLARTTFVGEFQEKNKTPIPFLRPQEAQQFEAYVDQLKPEQSTEFLVWVDRNTTSADQRNLADSIYKGTKNSAMAMGIAIANDAPQDAAMMVRGKRYFDDEIKKGEQSGPTGKGTFLRPSSKEILEVFEGEYNPLILPDPESRVIAREAAFYHYIGKKSKTKEGFSGDLDIESFKESMDAVIGPKVQMNGSEFIPFRKTGGQFAQPEDFEAITYLINDENLKTVTGSIPITISGESVQLQKDRSRISFQNAGGEGNYFLTRDNKAMLDSKTGDYYIFNARQFLENEELQKAVKEKRNQILSRQDVYRDQIL